VDLRTAVARAREVWDRERQYAVSVDTVREHWGYRSLNGPASLLIAALRKYGLVSVEGSGNARRLTVTDLAVTIFNHPDDAQRARSLQEAALNPDIHQEMWAKHGTAKTVSDTNLKWELTRERGFTETGATEFLREYRETVNYAHLLDDDTSAPQTVLDEQPPASNAETDPLAGPDGDEPDPPGQQRPVTRRRIFVDAETAQYAIPLKSQPPVLIEGTFPISEEDWQQMMTVLDAMKPGLVRPKE
jgi:hypothetical protein